MLTKRKTYTSGRQWPVGGLRIRFVRRAAFNGEGGGQKGLDLISGVLDLISSGVTTIRTIFIVFFFFKFKKFQLMILYFKKYFRIIL